MKELYKGFELFLLAGCACCFLFLPEAASQGTMTGLHICATAILPNLFPFFVLTDYWVNAGYADSLAALFAPMMSKFFHIPGTAASALVLGSIGGYPVGARTVAQLYKNKKLSSSQAEQALFFTNNAGPAFVLGVLGNQVFQSVKTGILLYVIHLIAAYLTGFIFRQKEYRYEPSAEHQKRELTGASKRLTNAITESGTTIILVCTYVLFFAILIQCIRYFMPSALWTSILIGTLELAGGANALISIPISQQVKFIIASLLLGFGGLCVLLQSISVLQTAGLSARNLLIGKISHGILSGLLAAFISPFLPSAQPCAAAASSVPALFLPQILIILLFLLFSLIFLKKSSGKLEKNQI